jgi:hypothetical protein
LKKSIPIGGRDLGHVVKLALIGKVVPQIWNKIRNSRLWWIMGTDIPKPKVTQIFFDYSFSEGITGGKIIQITTTC